MEESTKEQREYEQKVRLYETATDERKLELDLFWKRSTFFWAFIASSFVAYAALKDDITLRLFVASFGLICSLAWTLANRGSKYWYEMWEKKVEAAQNDVIGQNIYEKTYSANHPGRAWSGKRYSVSRLAIGLSDFTVIIWSMLFIITATKQCYTPPNWPALAAIFATIIYALSLLRGGRSAF